MMVSLTGTSGRVHVKKFDKDPQGFSARKIKAHWNLCVDDDLMFDKVVDKMADDIYEFELMMMRAREAFENLDMSERTAIKLFKYGDEGLIEWYLTREVSE